MSVSDQSGDGDSDKPRPIKRRQRTLSKEEWRRIQTHYETDQTRIGLRPLADLYGVPRQTVMLRAAKEKWRRQDTIVTEAKRELNLTTREIIRQTAEPVIEALAKKALDDLSPWIERKKRTHIRSQVNRSHRALSRLDKLTATGSKLDAKGEAFIAKSVDTYDNVARRNLGMNDSSLAGGSLSLRILTGGAAIELQAGQAGQS